MRESDGEEDPIRGGGRPACSDDGGGHGHHDNWRRRWIKGSLVKVLWVWEREFFFFFLQFVGLIFFKINKTRGSFWTIRSI